MRTIVEQQRSQGARDGPCGNRPLSRRTTSSRTRSSGCSPSSACCSSRSPSAPGPAAAARGPHAREAPTLECGVDPVGEGWAHTQVRYYVYAFLYVIFAVDSIFLFPWATVFAAPGYGATTLVEMFIFLGFLAVGLLYAYKKGPLEDRHLLLSQPCSLFVTGAVSGAEAAGALARLAPEPMKGCLNPGRRYSLWVFNFGLACCAIEFIAASMARHDFIRLGVIPFAPGPRQADLMVVSGTVTDKMAPAVKRLYEQMPEPKYVISFGACSNCGGPYWDSYSVTKGVDQIIPVDVYVPGCPPRPEALLQGILKLQAEDRAGVLGRAVRVRHGAPFLRRR
ncbi:NAD(P)H-quinone oxidoreductase subunit K, chloroplastic [Streptomyces alboniger]